MPDPEPASSPCQAPPGHWGEDDDAAPAHPPEEPRAAPAGENAPYPDQQSA